MVFPRDCRIDHLFYGGAEADKARQEDRDLAAGRCPTSAVDGANAHVGKIAESSRPGGDSAGAPRKPKAGDMSLWGSFDGRAAW